MTDGLPELLRELLRVRGVETDADLAAFLDPSLKDLVDPLDGVSGLPGLREAAEEILADLTAGRGIVVFGDYDCDGISATAILARTLSALGAKDVATFLPRRLDEGYGMNDASVGRMLAEHPGVGLVITVDNGINAVEHVAALKARGVHVIVTDHHLPDKTLPDCCVVDPMCESVPAEHPLKRLCGAGVAFFLANALVSLARSAGVYSGPAVSGPLLVLAGLATVTDVMPLLGQNRILVSEALKRFHRLAPIGLRELYDRASRTATASLGSKDFGFLLGPRINAAGRLATADEALELVMSDDREIARESARIVDMRNVERRTIEQKMLDLALSKVVAGAAAQVIDLTGGHIGVAGIVAARVMEKLSPSVPTCVIVDGHGSARAPEGFNVRDALGACAEFLDRYGGHAAAAGFSVRSGQVDAFREKFVAVCASQRGERPEADRTLKPDIWVTPADLTLDFANWIPRLEPFGEGNLEPVFGFRRATVRDVRAGGVDSRHLFFEANGFRAVWWGEGDRLEELRSVSASHPCDLTFTVGTSTYGGAHVELRLRALEASADGSA